MGRADRILQQRSRRQSHTLPSIRASSTRCGRQGQYHVNFVLLSFDSNAEADFLLDSQHLRVGEKFANQSFRQRKPCWSAHHHSTIRQRGRHWTALDRFRFVDADHLVPFAHRSFFHPFSADGHVRLFRHYESPNQVRLVSSFQGISETLPTTTGDRDAGLVVEWQQGRGQALMGGNVKYIRVWDATRETILQVSSLDEQGPLPR